MRFLFSARSRCWLAFGWIGLFAALACPVHASKVDPQNVPSASMNKTIPVNVILPEGYDGTKTFPVVYLLHGAGDHNDTWINATSITSLADEYGVIVVCPAAELSWYFDSPENPASKYETFISSELVTFIDGHYRTIADRKHRATVGNSMGGHGALFIAIRHQDTFGIAVSISGAVDLRPFADKWTLDQLIGSIKDHPDRWNDLSVITLAKQLKDGDLTISIDCGESDFFIDVNRALHAELLEQKVAHDYTERPGYHGWSYWPNAIKFQMLYVSEQFKKADEKK